jgi:hypothetical protein
MRRSVLSSPTWRACAYSRSRVDTFNHISAILFLAWAEDRAMLGSNPSANPGAKTEAGCHSWHPVPFSFKISGWHPCGKSRGLGGRAHKNISIRNGSSFSPPTLPCFHSHSSVSHSGLGAWWDPSKSGAAISDPGSGLGPA